MHAVGLLPSAPDIEDRAATLERLFGTDPFPGVRRQALAVISEHLPETVPGLFPRALLDRSAGVRSLARFVAHRHHVPVVPRDLYVERLSSTVATDVWVAIQGIGETGTRSDADLVMPFLDAGPPRLRAFALRALTRLEPDRALAPALDALADAASPVWIAGVNAIAANGRRADFEGLSVRMRSIANPRTRTRLLKILASAPKWDAAALLLDALRDPDEVVRAAAAGWVDAWVGDFNHSQVPPTSRQLERIHALLSAVADRMPPETVNRLRFSLRP
jgi:HEAT repeat protein